MTDDLTMRLLNYLPDYYQKAKKIEETVMYELQRVSVTELQKVLNQREDLFLQFFPQTATWGLSFWEELCGLPDGTGDTYEDRRRKVIAQLSAFSPITAYRIEQIGKQYANDCNVIEHYNEYSFDLILNKCNNFDFNVDELVQIIKKVKPAHLVFAKLILKHISDIQIQNKFSVYQIKYKRCGTFTSGQNGGL
ncbi:DUF2313 domain-containing protein [Aneurinibacillus thermoaerophilus]|uniref:putative phage tail protein n=1 Tax=Aneurinibacillus thermoaerophilus TaxID=143495 RepID=UPI002E22E8BE|nr:DUF2313 domain-containing protein [Aneurinibacillus thermoaerophilus]MED0766016.1 DUF2313 domain-containing protein [Aneurinibacillus thermoaerophilus]